MGLPTWGADGHIALNPPDKQLRGVNIAWPLCQQGDSGHRVLLKTVDILNLGCNTGELELQVAKHDRPANAFFQCPLFVLCDEPVYTKVCAGSNLTARPNPEPPYANNAACSTNGLAWLNPSPARRPCCLGCSPTAAECTVAIEPRTWSRLKTLYRD